MKNLFIHCLLLVIINQYVYADDKLPAGARAAALGLCSVSLSDFWSLVNNQAAMADYDKVSAGFYLENRFLQKELALKTIGIIVPTPYGILGLSHSYWGFSKFHEQKTGLAYSRKVSKFLNIGIQLDYISRYIGEGYGNNSIGTVEAGIYGKLTSKLFIGAHLFNPVQRHIHGIKGEIAPVTYRFGFTYLVNDKVTAIIETEKELRYNPAIRGGMEYQVHEKAIARLGFTSIPAANGTHDAVSSSMITFGFGTILGKLKIDFGSSFHTLLGSSIQFSVIYTFRQQ